MLLHRRKFLTGLGSLLAAPAIVRAASLMPIKALPPEFVLPDFRGLYMREIALGYSITRQAIDHNLYYYGDLLEGSFIASKEILAAEFFNGDFNG